LVDEYDEIAEFLEDLVARYRRRTLFVSASAAHFEPWGHEAVTEFAEGLGGRLISSGTRLATGIGLGFGDALLSGALREVMRTDSSIEENLVLRPFPQSGDTQQRATVWKKYREEITSHAGIAVFLFGTKQGDDGVVLADGMEKEFEIARAQGLAVVPVGATGGMSKELSDRTLADPAQFIPELGANGSTLIQAMADHTDDLSSLIEPVIAVIRKLQGGNAG
jgi:hypothetical protein